MSSTEASRFPLVGEINNEWLETLLTRHMKVSGFRGVYPCDLIPRLEHGESIIVNTDPADQPGWHYTSLYKRKGRYYYFDPLALHLPISFPRLWRELHQRKIIPRRVLRQPIQAQGSRFCGLFCVDYVLSVSVEYKNVPRETYCLDEYDLQRNNETVMDNILKCIESL